MCVYVCVFVQFVKILNTVYFELKLMVEPTFSQRTA